MADPKMDRLLIAAPEAVAAKLTGILVNAGIDAQMVVHTGEEAISACIREGTLLLTTFRLPDMTGEELVSQLHETLDVLMIVPQGYENPLPGNVLTLVNPISPDALTQAVRVMAHCQTQKDELRAKAQKATRMLEERKTIDRAKGRLMDTLHITEKEAHHYIQKKSMDSGHRIADVAKEILEVEDITAEQ